VETMDGNNEDIGERLVWELRTNLKMILEYSNTLSREDRLKLVRELDSAVDELTDFANDLNLSTESIGE